MLARYVSPPMGRLEPASGHRCVLTGTTSNPSMYAGEWLAAIPIPFHVEGGPELRAAVAAVAERLTSALSAGLRRGQVCVCGQGERGWQVQCLALGMAEREVLTVLVDQFHYLLADRPLVWVWLDALGGGEEHKDVCVGDAVEQADRREQPPGPLGQVHVGIGALRYRRAVGSVPQPACGAGGPATIGRSVTVGECSITGTRAGTA